MQNDKIKYNPLKNLSTWRLAGIKKFLIANVYENDINLIGIKTKDPFYKISRTDLIKNYEIVFSAKINFEGDYGKLSNDIKKKAEENTFQDACILIGINECRVKQFTIPAEVDDLDLWMMENSGKFLPEGVSPGEFVFSYEIVSENEDSKSFIVLVSRKSYVDSIKKVFKTPGSNILGITTFALAIHQLECSRNENVLFINILSDRMIFSYSGQNNQLIYDEIYSENKGEALRGVEEKYRLHIQEIKELIKANNGDMGIENIKVYLSTHEEIENILTEVIKLIFNLSELNKEFDNADLSQLSAMIGLNKLFTDNDHQMNLLEESEVKKGRNFLEKKLSQRVILSLGLIILILLLVLNVGESYINKKMTEGSDFIENVNTKVQLLEKKRNENSILKGNLSSLIKLKNKSSNFSNSLQIFSQVMNKKSCLGEVDLIKEKDGQLKMEISGISLEQGDVVDIIRKMESVPELKNVALLQSNSIERKKIKLSFPFKRKDVVRFNIKSEYYENSN